MIPDNVNGGGSCPKREDALRSESVKSASCLCSFENMSNKILSNNRCELKMWELMTHSLSSRFLDRVRIRLEGRPQDYSDFLNIMRVNSLTSATSVLLSLWSSIIGAEVRISEHKLCHRKGLSPISGNFNPTSSSILCKLILPKSRLAVLFAEDSQNAIHNFYSQDFFSLYLTNHHFPNFIPGSKWYLHFIPRVFLIHEFPYISRPFLILDFPYPGFSITGIYFHSGIFVHFHSRLFLKRRTKKGEKLSVLSFS